jgi:hypothetical protein
MSHGLDKAIEAKSKSCVPASVPKTDLLGFHSFAGSGCREGVVFYMCLETVRRGEPEKRVGFLEVLGCR